MKVSALREVVIAVEDLDVTSRWYAQTFGLAPLAEKPALKTSRGAEGEDGLYRTIRLARYGGPTYPRLALFQVSAPVGAARGQLDLTSHGPVGIGFTTPEIHASVSRLRAAGAEPISDPMCLSSNSNVPDPGMSRWEVFVRLRGGEYAVLIQRDGAPLPYGTFSAEQPLSEPLHASFVVADLERTLRFYTNVLGHQPIVQEHCAGPMFEQLMALESGTSFDFIMVKAPEENTGRVVLMAFADASEGGASQSASSSSQPTRTGIYGLRYETNDLDRLVARAVEWGFDPIPESPGADNSFGDLASTAFFDVGLGCLVGVGLDQRAGTRPS